jgi:hypothetical protein
VEYKVKVYPKEEGADKVTALVTYFRPESVPLAINLLDETEIKPGNVIKVAEVRIHEKLKFYQFYLSLKTNSNHTTTYIKQNFIAAH